MYVFNKKNIAFVLALIVLLTTFVGSTLAVIIVKTDDIMNIFRPQDPTGTLQITKTVQHPFDATYEIPDNIQFRYVVDVGRELVNTVLESSAGDVTVAPDGTVVLTVKPGLSAELRGIPTGIEAKITEIDIPAGFTPVGGAKKTTTIPMRNTVYVEYVNIYEPAKAPVNVTLDGVKELEGRDWMEGDSFTFALSHKADGVWQELSTAAVTYDAQNATFNHFSFTDTLKNFSFDKVGTYSFRISEVKGSIGGIDYENEDKTVSYLDVTVTDTDMDGTLEISKVAAGKNAQVTESAGTFDVDVTIRNTYVPDGTAQATVLVNKLLEDKSGRGLLPEGFRFQLLDNAGNVVATSDPTGAAGETGITLTYQAIDAGRQFTYTLQEIAGTQKGMTYDPTVYTLKVDVIDDLDGTISAVIYKAGDSAPHSATCSLSFRNTYDPEDATAQLTGTKELTGRKLANGEFTFLLYPSSDGVNIPDGAVPMKAVNDATGAFAFDSITYDKVGIYRYIAQEDATAKLGGVTYDETRVYVTVTITDEDGTLKAQVETKDLYGNACPVTFKNTYSAASTWLELIAKKTLEGAELTKGQFTFLLYQTDAQMTYDAERPLQVLQNDAEGPIKLERLTYSEVGTYRYVLLEDTRQLQSGMMPDGTVYGIIVRVTDDGEGALEAQATLQKQVKADDGQGGTKLTWETVNEMTFHNVYVAPPTTEPPTSEPSETKPGQKPGTPETADKSNVELVIVLAVLSFAGLVALLIIGIVAKRRQKLAEAELPENAAALPQEETVEAEEIFEEETVEIPELFEEEVTEQGEEAIQPAEEPEVQPQEEPEATQQAEQPPQEQE